MVSVPAEIPVTMPVVPMAASVLLLLHVPPAMPSVNVIEEATHTLDRPVITPAFGEGFIVMVFVAVAVLQVLVTEYLIVSVPAVTPVTTPNTTVAEMLLLLHVPPAAPSVKRTDEPTHTLDAPVMTPAFGNGFTRMDFVATAVPHVEITV